MNFLGKFIRISKFESYLAHIKKIIYDLDSRHLYFDKNRLKSFILFYLLSTTKGFIFILFEYFMKHNLQQMNFLLNLMNILLIFSYVKHNLKILLNIKNIK